MCSSTSMCVIETERLFLLHTYRVCGIGAGIKALLPIPNRYRRYRPIPSTWCQYRSHLTCLGSRGKWPLKEKWWLFWLCCTGDRHTCIGFQWLLFPHQDSDGVQCWCDCGSHQRQWQRELTVHDWHDWWRHCSAGRHWCILHVWQRRVCVVVVMCHICYSSCVCSSLWDWKLHLR